MCPLETRKGRNAAQNVTGTNIVLKNVSHHMLKIVQGNKHPDCMTVKLHIKKLHSWIFAELKLTFSLRSIEKGVLDSDPCATHPTCKWNTICTHSAKYQSPHNFKVKHNVCTFTYISKSHTTSKWNTIAHIQLDTKVLYNLKVKHNCTHPVKQQSPTQPQSERQLLHVPSL